MNNLNGNNLRVIYLSYCGHCFDRDIISFWIKCLVGRNSKFNHWSSTLADYIPTFNT